MKYLLSFLVTLIMMQSKAQQSCTNWIHFKSKNNDAVTKVREINNNRVLIAGNSSDSLFYLNSFIHEDSLFAFLMEIDNSNDILFSKYFSLINVVTGFDYIRCVDAMKDNAGNYYALINWTGTLKIDAGTFINAENGLIVLKILPNGNVSWYYYLNYTNPTSFCMDNQGNLMVLAYAPSYFSYSPYSIILFRIHSQTGQIKKSKIGSNAFSKINSGKIYYYQNYFYWSCSFKDSIYFSSNQTLKGQNYVSAVVKMDTNFNIIQYTLINTHTSTQDHVVNDFIVDNNGDLFLTGNYKSANLYIRDTIRLTAASSIVEKMFLVKWDKYLNFQWAKQEIQNPTNSNNNKVRDGYALTANNSYIYLLSRLFNSVILGTDTLNGNSLLLIQYDKNGNYIQSEKIAGKNAGGVYTLNYLQSSQQILVSSTFAANITICQNTLMPLGSDDVYLVWMDQLTSVSSNTQLTSINKIYPNPANDRIYLSLQNHTENFIYTLTDVTGKQVLNGISSGSTLSIDTSSLPGGLYILNIVGHSLNEYYKVVINH